MKIKQILSFGSFRLDIGNRQLLRGQRELKLTGKAFEVLRCLVEQPGQLVTKEEFSETVWPGIVAGDAALPMCIREWRKTLKDNARAPRFIEAVYGQGYRFVAEVRGAMSGKDRTRETLLVGREADWKNSSSGWQKQTLANGK